MITTSQAWKDYSRDTGIFHIRATMTGSSTVNLTDSDFMMGSVSFTDSISGMNEITFGSVVTNTFTATLVNTDGRFDNWRWNRISVEFGYGNEWISRGVYNIDRPETIGSTVKIECYDDMDRLNQYFKGFITQTFPVTYKALIQAICTACGVTFGTWASGIPNTNVTALVASAFNESTTCRQVVSWILEVCGAYARINPVTHQLDCKVWNSTGGYNLTGVKDQSIYIDDVTITGVRAYTYNTNDEYDYATAGTDGYVVYIRDNPFVSATNKADIAAQALTNGGGGSVRPFTATIFGDPAMEAGDIVTFTDRRNNTYTSVITSLTYNLNGTMRVSCDAKTPQDNSLDYSNPYDSAVWASISYTDNAVEEISSDLQSQIDAKIETYYQNTDPSTSWTTTALKNAHVGDIWHNSDTNKSYRWGGTAWQEIDGVPQSLLDTVDGKTTIHYGTTSSVTTADDGDYLVDKTNGITYRRQNNAWVEQISSPAVNLLPPVYRREYQEGTNTYTSNGITWTVNDDGSVTANGTATATSYFTLTANDDALYPPRAKLDPTKRYRLHGCPSGGTSTTYRMRCQRVLVDGTSTTQNDNGSGVTLTANAKTAYVYLEVANGYNAGTNGITFYPMLEEGTVDHAYVSPKNANANYTNVQISSLQSTLETQIDAKVETWASSNNPATAWTTTELKNQHDGDLWYYTGTTALTVDSVTISPSKTYQYNASTDKWASYNNPSESLYDFADGKSTIYYGTTSSVTSADDGDFLVDKTSGATYRRQNNAWVEQIASPVVNLMPPLYQSESQYGTSRTASGITWTLNKDGSLTANGTATANTSFIIAERNLTDYTVPCITVDPNQRYILHGCPANGTSKYRITARCTPSGVTPAIDTGSVVYDYGDGVLVPAGTKYIYTYCQIINGNTVSNLTFYPMLEVGTVKHGFVSNRSNIASYTESKVTALDNSFNQTKVFNRLTNNGQLQGLYMDGGDMYINATYIKTGDLQAERIGNGTIGSAITASNLTMTGGSINVTAQSVGTDIIRIQSSDTTRTIASTISGESINVSRLSSTQKGSAGASWGTGNKLGLIVRDTTDSSLPTGKIIFAAYDDGTMIALGESMVDSVIEEGTWGSAGWWRKWHSGKAECHGYASVTTAISTPYGAGYYTSTAATFPTNLFVASPVVNITLERNGGLLFPSISSSSKNSVNFYIASLAQESSATIWYHVSAFGMWKS